MNLLANKWAETIRPTSTAIDAPEGQGNFFSKKLSNGAALGITPADKLVYKPPTRDCVINPPFSWSMQRLLRCQGRADSAGFDCLCREIFNIELGVEFREPCLMPHEHCDSGTFFSMLGKFWPMIGNPISVAQKAAVHEHRYHNRREHLVGTQEQGQG